MELSLLYTAILGSLNVVPDESDLLSLVYGEQSHPITVDGKRLVLPTQDVLRAGIGSSLIGFHPLSENILRGESPVLKKLKVLVTNRLTEVLSELMLHFVDITINHPQHAKLSPDQKDLLLSMPDADEKTKVTLMKIFEAIRDDGRKKLLSVYLKRGGKLRNEKYSRTAIIAFPIIGEFENTDRNDTGNYLTVFGVPCRKKDFAGIAKLIEYILPNADGAGYSYGSNDQDVPYFDALLRAFINVAAQLNTRSKMFAKQLGEYYKALSIDLSWATPENMSWAKYRDKIPVLTGNDGTTTAEEQSEGVSQVEAPAPRNAPMTFDLSRVAGSVQPEANVSAHQPQRDEAKKSSTGLNWQEAINNQTRRLLQPGPGYATVPTGNQSYPYQPTAAAPPGVIYAMPAPQTVPPGFAAAPQPNYGVDQFGRPMVAPIVMAPPQTNYGVDQFGRPMAMAPQPAPQQYVDQYGHPCDQFGRPLMMAPAPQPTYGVDQFGRTVVMTAPQGQVTPPGFAPPPMPQGHHNPNRIPSFAVAQPAYNPGGYVGFQNGAVPVRRY